MNAAIRSSSRDPIQTKRRYRDNGFQVGCERTQEYVLANPHGMQAAVKWKADDANYFAATLLEKLFHKAA